MVSRVYSHNNNKSNKPYLYIHAFCKQSKCKKCIQEESVLGIILLKEIALYKTCVI